MSPVSICTLRAMRATNAFGAIGSPLWTLTGEAITLGSRTGLSGASLSSCCGSLFTVADERLLSGFGDGHGGMFNTSSRGAYSRIAATANGEKRLDDFLEKRRTTTSSKEISECSLGQEMLFTAPQITTELEAIYPQINNVAVQRIQQRLMASKEAKPDLAQALAEARTILFNTSQPGPRPRPQADATQRDDDHPLLKLPPPAAAPPAAAVAAPVAHAPSKEQQEQSDWVESQARARAWDRTMD